jgi:hypothetical protein
MGDEVSAGRKWKKKVNIGGGPAFSYLMHKDATIV